MNPKFSQVKHITKRFQKIFNFFFKNDDVSNSDVINFIKFYTYSAWILHIKIYTLKKTGTYVKNESFSFQKMKTELENLALIRFYCDFSKEYFSTGQR